MGGCVLEKSFVQNDARGQGTNWIVDCSRGRCACWVAVLRRGRAGRGRGKRDYQCELKKRLQRWVAMGEGSGRAMGEGSESVLCIGFEE